MSLSRTISSGFKLGLLLFLSSVKVVEVGLPPSLDSLVLLVVTLIDDLIPVISPQRSCEVGL